MFVFANLMPETISTPRRHKFALLNITKVMQHYFTQTRASLFRHKSGIIVYNIIYNTLVKKKRENNMPRFYSCRAPPVSNYIVVISLLARVSCEQSTSSSIIDSHARELQKLRAHEIDCRWAKRGHRGRRAIRMDGIRR
jgi:hypothetical protein